MQILILAGGKGTRLWPYALPSFPKQFLAFKNEPSFLQKTVLRFLKAWPLEKIWVLTHSSYKEKVEEQLKAIDSRLLAQILYEPEQKNTGPAVVFAIRSLEALGCKESERILVTPSDHFFSSEENLILAIQEGNKRAEKGNWITFGVSPHRPETGYGYLKKGKQEGLFIEVEQFIEKPDREKALFYLKSHSYLWNTGVYLFQIKHFWSEIQLYAKDLYKLGSLPLHKMKEGFNDCPPCSLDQSVMQSSSSILTYPLQTAWSDIGSWDSLFEILDKDQNQNASSGSVVSLDTKNCLILGAKRPIATLGVEDLLVVDTEDGLFIGKRESSQRVRELVDLLPGLEAKGVCSVIKE